MWQRAVDCEFLNKMSHASRIRTLFSLVVKNVSCEWKCCITTNADEGESMDGNKIHSCSLFRRIWCCNPNILYKDVESWLETQPVYTKYRRIKVKYSHRKVLSRGLRYQYQADLVDYSALKRDNHSFTFLLTIIDIFSRFALAIPIKSKKGPHVATALEKAFKVMKPPRKLQTDMGKEFNNSHVKRVLNRYRVHHFSTDQPLKAQIVEHFNRTLREMLKQSMAYRKSLDYISVLSDFLYG